MSILETGRSIIRNEGLSQLWRGMPSLLIRIFPYAGLQYWTNDMYRSMWKERGVQSWRQIGGMNVPVQNLACGSMAGVTATLITYPLDLIRSRMLYTSKKSQEYRTFAKTVSTLYSSSGVRTFYQGMTPAVIGMIPYAGISFGTFETIKELALSVNAPFMHYTMEVDGQEIKKLNWYVHTGAGNNQFLTR